MIPSHVFRTESALRNPDTGVAHIARKRSKTHSNKHRARSKLGKARHTKRRRRNASKRKTHGRRRVSKPRGRKASKRKTHSRR